MCGKTRGTSKGGGGVEGGKKEGEEVWAESKEIHNESRKHEPRMLDGRKIVWRGEAKRKATPAPPLPKKKSRMSKEYERTRREDGGEVTEQTVNYM